MNDPNLLEITEQQAIALYDAGKVVYIQCSGVTCDTAFNTFIMRNDTKDASLNMYLYGRQPSEVSLLEYIAFIQRNQSEPLRFHTFNTTELYMLPVAGKVNVSVTITD